MGRAELRKTGARQEGRAWKEDREKIFCGEEENRFIPSLNSGWIYVGRSGFSSVLEGK